MTLSIIALAISLLSLAVSVRAYRRGRMLLGGLTTDGTGKLEPVMRPAPWNRPGESVMQFPPDHPGVQPTPGIEFGKGLIIRGTTSDTSGRVQLPPAQP
jgi:hypothetical protein